MLDMRDFNSPSHQTEPYEIPANSSRDNIRIEDQDLIDIGNYTAGMSSSGTGKMGPKSDVKLKQTLKQTLKSKGLMMKKPCKNRRSKTTAGKTKNSAKKGRVFKKSKSKKSLRKSSKDTANRQIKSSNNFFRNKSSGKHLTSKKSRNKSARSRNKNTRQSISSSNNFSTYNN